MSKLADLVRRTTKIEGRRLGFGAPSAKTQPSVALVAIVSERWAQSTAEAAGNGADAILLAGRAADSDVESAVSAANGKPCGLLAPEIDVTRQTQLQTLGLDFVALDNKAPASVLANEDIGIVLHVRDELTDIQLRTLESLRLDAIYIDTSPAPLTISRLMELRRISGLARKPLLLLVAHDTAQEDLIALRDSGVTLLGVDMKDKGAPEALKNLRYAVDGLPEKRPRKDEAGEPLLPRAAVAATSDSDDEDDD